MDRIVQGPVRHLARRRLEHGIGDGAGGGALQLHVAHELDHGDLQIGHGGDLGLDGRGQAIGGRRVQLGLEPGLRPLAGDGGGPGVVHAPGHPVEQGRLVAPQRRSRLSVCHAGEGEPDGARDQRGSSTMGHGTQRHGAGLGRRLAVNGAEMGPGA